MNEDVRGVVNPAPLTSVRWSRLQLIMHTSPLQMTNRLAVVSTHALGGLMARQREDWIGLHTLSIRTGGRTPG